MSSTDHPFLASPDKLLLIGGQWLPAASGRRIDAINPATGKRIATLAEGDAVDVDAAVVAARHAFEEGPWSRFTPSDRQRLLLRIADLLEERADSFAILDTLDMGNPVRFTRGAIPLLLDVLRYFAGAARGIQGATVSTSTPGLLASTLKEPVGVCGAIIPWNGPLWASILKIAPVLATGCTLILKPAEDASLTPLMFAALCEEAGVPPGVINIVTGHGPVAGAALAAHLGVDKLSFTGSDSTGRGIVQAAAGNLKRLSLELGGKSPHIIFADADLARAAPAAAMAAFMNAGQVCSAGTRLYVQRSIHDAFVYAVVAHGEALSFGDALSDATDLGPLVSARQFARVSGYIASGKAAGARLLSGGNRPAGEAFAEGFYMRPTVFSEVADDMAIAREEIFGPVLSIFAFEDEAEAIRRANDTPFGLGAGLWTQDVSRAHRVGASLRAGSVWVNCYNALDPAVPSGGYKASGWGREYGPNHLEEHLNVKSFWLQV